MVSYDGLYEQLQKKGITKTDLTSEIGISSRTIAKIAKGEKLYRINPYSIGTTNGRYYLICNVDKYDTLCHFRIDRILDVKLLKKTVKPIEKVAGGKEGLSIQNYMASHPNMYSGTPEQFIIQLKKKWLNELFDTFGMDLSFRNETDETVEAILTADPISVGFWLKKYTGDAKLVVGELPID